MYTYILYHTTGIDRRAHGQRGDRYCIVTLTSLKQLAINNQSPSVGASRPAIIQALPASQPPTLQGRRHVVRRAICTQNYL